MGVAEIITGAVAGVFKPVGDFFTRRSELKSAEHQAKIAVVAATGERQAQLIKDGLAADMSWEMAFANQAANSWKDELELIVITVPLVLCFIPGMSRYVDAGFAALSKTPSWYMFLVMTIYLANYGIRYWRKTQSDT